MLTWYAICKVPFLFVWKRVFVHNFHMERVLLVHSHFCNYNKLCARTSFKTMVICNSEILLLFPIHLFGMEVHKKTSRCRFLASVTINSGDWLWNSASAILLHYILGKDENFWKYFVHRFLPRDSWELYVYLTLFKYKRCTIWWAFFVAFTIL